MKSSPIHLVLIAILLSVLSPAAVALADPNTEDPGQLTVPWIEFRRLLNLDDDQVVLSLDTFHKLLAQTSATIPTSYTVQDGNVVLSREAFRKLVNQMTPHVNAGAIPPFEYLITKAIYSGTMEELNTVFTATFHVHVLSTGVYLKVPVLPRTIALEDVEVDGKPALIVTENGHHHVVITTPGEHIVTAAFSMRSSIDKGPHRIDLTIVETPITLLQLDLPLKGIEVEVPQAQHLITKPEGDRTLISAVVTPGRVIVVRWRDAVDIADKIPPKLYSEVNHVVSIEDDVLRINSEVTYNILHSEVNRVRFLIPEGMNVLSITGDGIGEWQENTENGETRILVPFTYGRKGAVTIRVVTEKPLAEGTGVTEFSGIRVLDTVREIGFLGIEVKTSAEVTIEENNGLEPIGVPKLPQSLQAKAVKPLMHGFKYRKHPYNIVLSIRRHEKIAVPVATISSGNAVTLFTQDGKAVYRLVYHVKNSAKQFLEIDLPGSADVWTVFVDNQPVESALNSQGKLLVPLIRSRVENNNLASFPVEIVYCLVQDSFSLLAGREAALPPVDLLISQLIWSVYLPNDYTYMHFSGTLEKEEMIRSINLFAGAKRRYNEEAMKKLAGAVGFLTQGDESRGLGAGLDSAEELSDVYEGKEYDSRFRNLPLDKDQLSSQVKAELEFGSRLEGLSRGDMQQIAAPAGHGGTGVLPIQIQVPTGGQVYRFARTIVRPEDPLTMRVTYSANWLMSLVKWAAILFLAAVVYRSRRYLFRLAGWARLAVIDLVGFCREREDLGKRIAQSIMTPVVLLGLLGPAWSVSQPLTLLVLFLLWMSVVYQIVLRTQRRARARAVVRGSES